MPGPTPKLILALPLPGPGMVADTVFTIPMTSDGVLLPADMLRSSIERVLLQLVIFLNRNTAGLIEACLALVPDDFARVEPQLQTTVKQTGTGWVKRLSATVDVTARLQREAVLGVKLVARVDTGSALYMSPTLLVLRLTS